LRPSEVPICGRTTIQMQPPTLPSANRPLLPVTKTPVVLTAIITSVAVSLFWILAIAGLAYYFTRNTPSFAVKIDAPSHAEVGETITVQMKVRNPNNKMLTLSTIGVENSLFDGFKVTGVSPSASVAPGLGSSIYYFSKTLSPDETVDVAFDLEAVKPGVWTGNVDFSDPSSSFITSSTTIRVDEVGKGPKETESEDVAYPPFVLDIETPHNVALGENFTLRATIKNPTDSPLLLSNIDLLGPLANFLVLQKATPEPKEYGSDDDAWFLSYSKSLPAGETMAIELEVKPIKEGIWTGDLSFWGEESTGFVSSSLTFRVHPPATKETPSPD
jgi:hypothetical protein